MRTNGKYGKLDNILHRTESSDWVATVLGLEKPPNNEQSIWSREPDQKKDKKERITKDHRQETTMNKKFVRHQENNAIIQHAVDKIILQE